jgi:hypothetical protein
MFSKIICQVLSMDRDGRIIAVDNVYDLIGYGVLDYMAVFPITLDKFAISFNYFSGITILNAPPFIIKLY